MAESMNFTTELELYLRFGRPLVRQRFDEADHSLRQFESCVRRGLKICSDLALNLQDEEEVELSLKMVGVSEMIVKKLEENTLGREVWKFHRSQVESISTECKSMVFKIKKKTIETAFMLLLWSGTCFFIYMFFLGGIDKFLEIGGVNISEARQGKEMISRENILEQGEKISGVSDVWLSLGKKVALSLPVSLVWRVGFEHLTGRMARLKAKSKSVGIVTRISELVYTMISEYITKLPTPPSVWKIRSTSGEEEFGVAESALAVMVGKNCFAIASQRPLGEQTTATDCKKIYKFHDKLFMCLAGATTDVETLFKKLICEYKLSHDTAQRDMEVETFASLVSSLIHEEMKSGCPFFCRPVIVGLGNDDKPFLCTVDCMGGNIDIAQGVSITASGSLFEDCKSVFKPDMEAEELFDTIKEAVISSMNRDGLVTGCEGHVYLVTPTGVTGSVISKEEEG